MHVQITKAQANRCPADCTQTWSPRAIFHGLGNRIVWLAYHPIAATLLVVIYQSLLLFVYKYSISPFYEYMGLTFIQPDHPFAYLPFFVAPAIAFGLSILPARATDPGLYLIFISLIAGSITLVPFIAANMPLDTLLKFMFVGYAGFLLFVFASRLPMPKLITQVRVSRELSWYFWALIGAALMFYSLWLVSLSGPSFDLSIRTAYDRRLAARELLAPGSIEAYLSGLFRGGVLPLACAGAALARKYYLLPVVVATVIASWNFDGQKKTLVLPLFVLAAAYVGKRGVRGVVALIMCTFVGAVVLSLLESYCLHTDIVAEVFLRRLIAVPARISLAFYDYVQTNGPVNFAGSWIGDILGEPPDLPLVRLIGLLYMGDVAANANTNFIYSGYADFGWAGALGMSFAGGILLAFLNALPTRAATVASLTSIALGAIWIDQALNTSLLSSGVLALCLGAAILGGSMEEPKNADLLQ